MKGEAGWDWALSGNQTHSNLKSFTWIMISSREYHPPWDWMFCNISKFPRRFPCTVSSFASVMCHLLILPDSPRPACLAPDHRDCYSGSITTQQRLPALGPCRHFSSEPLSSVSPSLRGTMLGVSLMSAPTPGPAIHQVPCQDSGLQTEHNKDTQTTSTFGYEPFSAA